MSSGSSSVSMSGTSGYSSDSDDDAFAAMRRGFSDLQGSFIHMNGLVSQLTAEVGQLNDNDRDVRPLVNEVHRTNVRSRVLHTLMVQWSWLVFDTGSYSDGVPSD